MDPLLFKALGFLFPQFLGDRVCCFSRLSHAGCPDSPSCGCDSSLRATARQVELSSIFKSVALLKVGQVGWLCLSPSERRQGPLNTRRFFFVSVGIILAEFGFDLPRRYFQGILGWPGRQFSNARNFICCSCLRMSFVGPFLMKSWSFFLTILCQVGPSARI